MAAEKAPYKLVVKLESAQPDAIGDALNTLRVIAGDFDQIGEASASVTFESYQERPLSAICEAFEAWLYERQLCIGCELRVQRPGVRPEMLSVLRARQATPMDRAGWNAAGDSGETVEGEGSAGADMRVIEPPAPLAGLLPSPLLALPAPDDALVINAEFTVDAD